MELLINAPTEAHTLNIMGTVAELSLCSAQTLGPFFQLEYTGSLVYPGGCSAAGVLPFLAAD